MESPRALEKLAQAVATCDATGHRLCFELLCLDDVTSQALLVSSSVPFTLSTNKYPTLRDVWGAGAPGMVSGTGSILCIAMVMDQWSTVEWLLWKQPNPNSTLQGPQGETCVFTTPLHICVRSGIAVAYDTVAPALVRMGAAIHARDSMGSTPRDVLEPVRDTHTELAAMFE